MEEQEIDFTAEDTVNYESEEITTLQQEINQLENMLKFPLAFKSLLAGGFLGYALTKKLAKDNDIAIIGALASGYAAFNMFRGKDLTTEQKHSINEQIQARKARLQALGIEIKGETIGVLSAEELETMDYDKYIFGDDQYGEFMGNPAVGFHAIVFWIT